MGLKLLVEKVSGTYADTLKAVGLADLLSEVTGSAARIRSLGPVYEIEGADPGPIGRWPVITPGYPYILDAKDGNRPVGNVLDYEREREKAQRLSDYRQAKGAQRERLEAALREQGLDAPEAPANDYPMALFLASMRKGWASDKQLYRWIVEDQSRAKDLAANALGLGERLEEFPDISNSQVFNPIAGKGVHRPKPDSTSRASISKGVVDGVDEWLKFRGAYCAMLPYRIGDNFKVFVIEPSDIATDMLRRCRHEMLELGLYGGIKLDIDATWPPSRLAPSRRRLYRGIKLDIDATLRLLKILIHRSEEVVLYGRRPVAVIGGMHQAFFQSLGTAAALMNYSYMPLPSWFTVTGLSDAEAYLEVIREHAGEKRYGEAAGCLQVLREDNSGDVPILRAYREWLLTGSLSVFLDFLSRFSTKVMGCRAAKEWVREFSVDGLDGLFERGYGSVREIIENVAFRSLARAVRNATIYALGLKNREVFFGLAQEWKQKLKGGNAEFVAALCDFTQKYNWESEKINAHVIREKDLDAVIDRSAVMARKPKAHVIREKDLDAVIGLIEEHGAELVGMLLLAYGYARAPKAEHNEQRGEASDED